MSLSEEAFTQLGKLAETDRSLKFGINSMASIKLRTEKSFKDFLQRKMPRPRRGQLFTIDAKVNA